MRIFIPPEDIHQNNRVKVPSDKAHHLMTVLRGKTGDDITIIDGTGKVYSAVIAAVVRKDSRRSDVFVDIVGEIFFDEESPARIVLCQGILKGEKMTMVIQKTTELGINEIVPIVTDRSLVKDTRKIVRWRKIAEEATEQSKGTIIPLIHHPMLFKSYIERQGAAMRGHSIIFSEEGGLPLKEAVRKIMLQKSQDISRSLSRHSKLHAFECLPSDPLSIFIGPEGGFTSEEVCHAEKNGVIVAGLGRRILRAETAAIVAVTLTKFLCENLEISL
ncbi:MAG: RsmE family RNA methyltransferase [Dissulfurispiraceae bacterium]